MVEGDEGRRGRRNSDRDDDDGSRSPSPAARSAENDTKHTAPDAEESDPRRNQDSDRGGDGNDGNDDETNQRREDAEVSSSSSANNASITLDAAVDREKTCPFLLRIFYSFNGHHNVEDFRNTRIPDRCLPIYTWMDANLKEIALLVKEGIGAARHRGARLDFKAVFHRANGSAMFRDLGTVVSGDKTEDDHKTLGQLNFRIGDAIDLAIFTRRSGPGMGLGRARGMDAPLPPEPLNTAVTRDDFSSRSILDRIDRRGRERGSRVDRDRGMRDRRDRGDRDRGDRDRGDRDRDRGDRDRDRGDRDRRTVFSGRRAGGGRRDPYE